MSQSTKQKFVDVDATVTPTTGPGVRCKVEPADMRAKQERERVRSATFERIMEERFLDQFHWLFRR